MSEELNKQQKQASTILKGPLRIIAGAGTGKTKTIVARTVELINQGIDPKSIVLLTFTRKAAEELRSRCRTSVKERARGLFAGTFHSFCIHQFSKSPSSFGLSKNFTLLDRSDSLDIIKFIQDELTDEKDLKISDDDIAEIFCISRNLEKTIKVVIKECFPEHQKKEKLIQEVINGYKSFKARRNFLDYDDILFTFAESLKSKNLRDRINNEYKYIQVDEYQDTNSVQEKIIALLAGKNQNVAVVGDDFQSIYAFRGAKVSNILEFHKTFPACKTVNLEINYRSTQGILDLANKIVGNASFGIHKKLKANESIKSKPKLIEVESGSDEARAVADFVVSENKSGVKLGSIAVLMRQAYDSLALQGELNRRKIPYVLVGGQKLSEAAHVKDLLAVAKFGIGFLDELNIMRFLKLLKGVGGKTARKMLNAIVVRGFVDFDLLLKITPRPSHSEIRAVKAFCKGMSEKEPVENILKKTLKFYKPILVKKYDNHKKRLRELEAFIEFSSTYRDLRDLINDNVLDPTTNQLDDAADKQDVLVLSTVHSAKGLEWNSVAVINCNVGGFPSTYAKSQRELEEELRVFYVAITRAKFNLLLSRSIYDQKNGRTFSRISTFLRDIPKSIVRVERLKND